LDLFSSYQGGSLGQVKFDLAFGVHLE
jgi:hypothetical protein